MSQSSLFSEQEDLSPPDDVEARRERSSSIRTGLLKMALPTLAGVVLPLLLGGEAPRKFQADVYLNVASVDSAAIDKATKSLHSRPTLDNLIHAFNLAKGSDFAVDRPGVGRVVYDIVSGGGMTVSEAEGELRNRLSDAIAVGYDRGRNTVRIAVTAGDAEEARRLVSALSESFTDATNDSAVTADPALDGLRQALERAEAALSGFLSQTDAARVAELRQARADSEALAKEVARAEADLAAAHQKSAQAAIMTLADVLGKPLPDSLEYTGLEYQRQRYVQAKLTVDQLSANLGPRHPRLLAAQSAMDQVRADLQQALKQLATSLQRDESGATKQLSDLKARWNKAASDKDTVAAADKLGALEAAVEEARKNYLQGQQNRSATEAKPAAAKIQMLKAPVVRPLESVRSLPWAWCGAGAAIGMLAGLVFILLRRREEHDDELEVEQLEPSVVVSKPAVFAGPAELTDPVDRVMDGDWPDEDLLDTEGQFVSRPVSTVGYPQPANDMPLTDHIRELLMANRRPVTEASLPPLVAAVLAGGARPVETDLYRSSQRDRQPQDAKELVDLRRDMAELREKVQFYSERRQAARR